MARRALLLVEQLETRALLSGISYSLTMDQSVYQLGEPIPMTFTETNTGDQASYGIGVPIQFSFTVTNQGLGPVGFGTGPSIDGFDVMKDGTMVYQSNAGINPMIIEEEMLQPGDSFTLTATWNGVPNNGPPSVLSGDFTVFNQLDPSVSATFQIVDPSAQRSASPVTTPSPTPTPVPSPSPTPTPTSVPSTAGAARTSASAITTASWTRLTPTSETS